MCCVSVAILLKKCNILLTVSLCVSNFDHTLHRIIIIRFVNIFFKDLYGL